MIYLFAIGIAWIFIAAIAAVTMLTVVVLNSGKAEMLRAMATELPMVIGLASPGLLMMLVALVGLLTSVRRGRGQ